MKNKLTKEWVEHMILELESGSGIVATQPKRDNFASALKHVLPVLEAQEDAEKNGVAYVVCFKGGQVAKVDAQFTVGEDVPQ